MGMMSSSIHVGYLLHGDYLEHCGNIPTEHTNYGSPTYTEMVGISLEISNSTTWKLLIVSIGNNRMGEL
uniref:Uncharacterized protein n=1 Tax=Picea glauca TaxID=3330 RepID=A0A101M534_PICGL|nr:hypothetical protein ABT39_MTgene831 [Picea glauca]